MYNTCTGPTSNSVYTPIECIYRRNSQIENRIKNFNLEYRENHVSFRHPVHRYCIQHHTTDRIPNKMLRAEAVAGTKAVRLRGYINGKNLLLYSMQ